MFIWWVFGDGIGLDLWGIIVLLFYDNKGKLECKFIGLGVSELSIFVINMINKLCLFLIIC